MSETTAETTTRVVWFELPAEDATRAEEFYVKLFGWSFEPFGDDGYLVSTGAGGAISAGPHEQGVLTYFGVEDIDVSIECARGRGGESTDRMEVPGVGLYAHCSDTEGNRFGLFQRAA